MLRIMCSWPELLITCRQKWHHTLLSNWRCVSFMRLVLLVEKCSPIRTWLSTWVVLSGSKPGEAATAVGTFDRLDAKEDEAAEAVGVKDANVTTEAEEEEEDANADDDKNNAGAPKFKPHRLLKRGKKLLKQNPKTLEYV